MRFAWQFDEIKLLNELFSKKQNQMNVFYLARTGSDEPITESEDSAFAWMPNHWFGGLPVSNAQLPKDPIVGLCLRLSPHSRDEPQS